MHYSLDMITYCFPYGTRKFAWYRGRKRNSGKPELHGVITPYIDKKMTEQEADEFLCEIIRRHPFMKDAMWLEFHVMWHDGNARGFYHPLTIKNPECGEENRSYEPSPIQWR